MTTEQARSLQRTCRDFNVADRMLRQPDQSDEDLVGAAERYLRTQEAHAAEIATHDQATARQGS